jgi:spermidine synthase
MASADAPGVRLVVSHLSWPTLLLLGSGFSALVYQVLWLRLLGLVFGVTVHAASTVLAAFMAGLALGSFGGGRFADRTRAPLRWFGVAELLIGATALSTPAVLAALEAVYRQVHTNFSHDVGALTLVRFACSFAVLLVPTTMMGATMPLVLRSSATHSSDLGTRAAALYAANTAGALAGALVTGYYLVSQIGITASFRVAALVNLLVGLTAMLVPLRSAVVTTLSTSVEQEGDAVPPPRVRRLIITAFALSGFVALALEIIWFRALVMFLPATTYVFTIILATVLGGIAAGSAIATRALRRNGNWLARLAALQAGVAVAAVASLAAQAWTYAMGWRTSAALQASALSVLPTMLLMGAAFPIGLYCWSGGRGDSDRRIGDRIGRFYLANLSGAIAGAVLAGFVLIPWLGTRRALIAVASLSLFSALAFCVELRKRRFRHALAVAAGSSVLFATIAVLLPDPLEAVLERRYAGERLLWREEGAQATVSVLEGDQRVLYLDGLHQTNDSAPMLRLHRQIGALAMALHRDARDALVIGLGGGATAGAVAQFSNASVDIVELSPSVVAGAEWFRHANGDVLRRPNVELRVDDGRNYLLLTSKRYDVITADIIQPFHAGAGNLYSLQYYQLASRALRDDGLMLQWIGNRPKSQYTLIARTFLTAFPHTTVWADGTLLVGTKQPLRLSPGRYAERLADPAHAGGLQLAGIADFGGLLRLYTAGADELRRFIGDGPLLTDDRPLVEFFLSLPRDEGELSLVGLRGDVNRHVVP